MSLIERIAEVPLHTARRNVCVTWWRHIYSTFNISKQVYNNGGMFEDAINIAGPYKVNTLDSVTFSDLSLLIRSPSFVDKTLMIKTLLDNENFTIVAAPPKFGKSSILNMVQKFFEIEVTYHGLPKTKTNYLQDPVNDTENYQLFINNSLKITEYSELFAEHFGKTPVINIDFKQDLTDNVLIQCMYDVVKICKEVVHNSITQHKYLKRSARLTEDQRQYVRMWADQHSYKTMVDSLYVSHGLQSLAQYLHQHFGRRVMVLVDNYDFLLRHIVRHAKQEAEALRMVRYIVNILEDVVRGNDDHVARALITGVSVLPFLNYTDFNDCQTYSFLGNHKYFGFYGLSREEVEELYAKPEFSSSLGQAEIDMSHKHYGGYKNEMGKLVYNLFSVLKFLRSGKVGQYFTHSDAFNHFSDTFNSDLLSTELKQLLEGQVVSIDYRARVYLGDIITFNSTTPKFNLISYTLSDLLDWGLLTFEHTKSQPPNLVGVKIPNLEVKQFFQDFVKPKSTN